MAASNNKQHQAASCLYLFHQISISAAMVGGHSAHAVHWHSPDQRMVVVQTYIGSKDYTITPWQVNTVLPLVIMSIFYLFDSIWFYLYLLSIAFYRVWYNDTHWLTYQFAKREMMWDALDLDTLRSRQLWAGPPQLCDGFRSPRAAPLRAQGSCQDTKLIKTPWGRWKVLKMHENDWTCPSTLGNKEHLDTFRSNKKCVRHSHCSKLYHWDQWQNENSHAPMAHVSQPWQTALKIS